MNDKIISTKYLPFGETELLEHFVKVGKKQTVNKNHLIPYIRSINNYLKYKNEYKNIVGKPLSKTKKPCQIQRDERFWTANTLMQVYHSSERLKQLVLLFEKAFGKKVPHSLKLASWKDCFESPNLKLYFEVSLPSPEKYKAYLKDIYNEGKANKPQIIPYILASSHKKKPLEGSTKVDAMMINPDNGFAIVFEAKVLSDISICTTYDLLRNQIIRNIDMMLDNKSKNSPLDKRIPERTLFVLLTPKIFKVNSTSRLYGYKMRDYTDRVRGVDFLHKDLPHREREELEDVPSRIGWLTWQDFNDVNSLCSPWDIDNKTYL